MSQTRAAQSLVQSHPPLPPQYSTRTRKLSAREATRAFVSREVKRMVRVTRGDSTRKIRKQACKARNMERKLKSQGYQEDYEDAFKGE
ncbi:hypothetical protein BPAE_0004g01570 [Botrytis paeoniae]|uniref:Uncharacterized protein n=1 Tax=Botrytis paeoniae TaxID=278948 RepID=A0A4Z1G103_9HELO|nr:hypothetical protein BPAE_0004g01570 [Botrytis paeoniae]